MVTGAIKEDDKELKIAKNLGIRVVSRAKMLGILSKQYKNVISVAGTHGKTTTTGMISRIFLDAKLNPTVHIGGNMHEIQGNVNVGGNEFFITEACEYQDSFLSLKSDVSVILNVQPDHLDYFKTFETIKKSFKKFAGNTKKNGVVNKIRYSEKLPTTSELSKICSLLRAFEEETEDPYMHAIDKKLAEAEEDDMEIDVAIPMVDAIACIGKIDKINASKMNKVIFGKSPEFGIANTARITAESVMELAANAEKLRKRQNRNKMFIIGGIALLAVGGTATAVAIHNKHKKNADALVDEVESEVFNESADIDMDVDDTIDMDAPVVSMDE